MAKRAKESHQDVEFHVSEQDLSRTEVFKRNDEALLRAFVIALHRGKAVIDIVVWSEAGARWVGGEDGVASYREDPDASVFERYELAVGYRGRIA